MAKYLRITKPVEAEQWWPGNGLGVTDLTDETGYIDTLQKRERVMPGDWIVRGDPDTEIRVWRDGQFQKEYSLLGELQPTLSSEQQQEQQHEAENDDNEMYERFLRPIPLIEKLKQQLKDEEHRS